MGGGGVCANKTLVLLHTIEVKPLESKWRSMEAQKALRFHQKDICSCVLKMNKCLMGLEGH